MPSGVTVVSQQPPGEINGTTQHILTWLNFYSLLVEAVRKECDSNPDSSTEYAEIFFGSLRHKLRELEPDVWDNNSTTCSEYPELKYYGCTKLLHASTAAINFRKLLGAIIANYLETKDEVLDSVIFGKSLSKNFLEVIDLVTLIGNLGELELRGGGGYKGSSHSKEPKLCLKNWKVTPVSTVTSIKSTSILTVTSIKALANALTLFINVVYNNKSKSLNKTLSKNVEKALQSKKSLQDNDIDEIILQAKGCIHSEKTNILKTVEHELEVTAQTENSENEVAPLALKEMFTMKKEDSKFLRGVKKNAKLAKKLIKDDESVKESVSDSAPKSKVVFAVKSEKCARGNTHACEKVKRISDLTNSTCDSDGPNSNSPGCNSNLQDSEKFVTVTGQSETQSQSTQTETSFSLQSNTLTELSRELETTSSEVKQLRSENYELCLQLRRLRVENTELKKRWNPNFYPMQGQKGNSGTSLHYYGTGGFKGNFGNNFSKNNFQGKNYLNQNSNTNFNSRFSHGHGNQNPQNQQTSNSRYREVWGFWAKGSKGGQCVKLPQSSSSSGNQPLARSQVNSQMNQKQNQNQIQCQETSVSTVTNLTNQNQDQNLDECPPPPPPPPQEANQQNLAEQVSNLTAAEVTTLNACIGEFNRQQQQLSNLRQQAALLSEVLNENSQTLGMSSNSVTHPNQSSLSLNRLSLSFPQCSTKIHAQNSLSGTISVDSQNAGSSIQGGSGGLIPTGIGFDDRGTIPEGIVKSKKGLFGAV